MIMPREQPSESSQEGSGTRRRGIIGQSALCRAFLAHRRGGQHFFARGLRRRVAGLKTLCIILGLALSRAIARRGCRAWRIVREELDKSSTPLLIHPSDGS